MIKTILLQLYSFKPVITSLFLYLSLYKAFRGTEDREVSGGIQGFSEGYIESEDFLV